MPSAQNFEVDLRGYRDKIDEDTLKGVVTIVKQVVENSNRDMAMSIIKSKLFKKHGRGFYMYIAHEHERKVYYRIGGIKGDDAVLVDGKWHYVKKGVDIENLSMVEKKSLPRYYERTVLVCVNVVESFNLLNLALRKVMMMLKDRRSVQTLEIPNEVKDIMNKYWSF